MSERVAGVPQLYLYAGSIIVSGSVLFLSNVTSIRAGAGGLSYYIAMICAAGMVVVGLYEAATNDPDEYDVGGTVLGLIMLGALGIATGALLGFFGVW